MRSLYQQRGCRKQHPPNCAAANHLATSMIVLALICVAACSRHCNPQAALDHAILTLHHGDIAGAGEEAKRGYDRFHSLGAEWSWRFAILRAQVLYWGGENDKALDLLKKEPSPPCCGDLAVQKLRLEGIVHSAQHKFQDAEHDLSEALRICASGDFPACGDLNSTLGRMEMEKGHYSFAQDLFIKSLASARARQDKFMEADTLLKLSWSAEEQTHFDEAIDRADDAMRISLPLRFPDITESALGNTGWAYYKLGNLDKAEETFLEAEKQAEKIGLPGDQSKWLLNIGFVRIDGSDFASAEDSYKQSLAVAQKVSSREDIVNAYQALAFLSEQTGKLDDAKRYADLALSMAREDGNKRDETYPRLVQGRVAAKEHDPAAAEAAFHEVAESPDSPVFLKWEAERSLARLYEDENQTDLANREYRTALSTFEAARSELQHEDSRLPFLTNASGIYDDYIRFLVAHGKTDDALQVAEYQRGRTLAEGLGLLKRDLPQKALPKNPTSRGASLIKSGARGMAHPAAETSAQNGKTFRPEAIDPRAIARRAGGTIFFYSLGEKQSYLWAITAQKTSFFALPRKSEIDATVQRYRKELAEQEEFLPQADTDGRELYRTLVAPAQALLAQNKDARVFIIPDGSLNTLNFETLLVGKDNPPAHYWIEDVTIADASSLHVLSASRSGSAQRLTPQSEARLDGTAGSRGLPKPAHDSQFKHFSLLLLGDAISPSADYPELRKASMEMERIEKHFATGQQQVFARERATPAAYLTSKPEQFSYIHFVAHGTASRVSPLDSAIVLSPAGTQDDSFKLYARDIISHTQPRLHADLVTISTCYGAGSRAYSGEGLVGLSWAFLRAGAHNVIGALWEVSDDSTPQLMDELYSGLKQGQSPDDALRAAKLSLLRSKSAFNTPFYWAPFQLYTGS
jgi:CHAT domain-containing protein